MDKLRKIQLKYSRIFAQYDVPREYIDLICPYVSDNCILIPTIMNSIEQQCLVYDLDSKSVSHPNDPSEFYDIVSCENDHLRSLVYQLVEEMLVFLGCKLRIRILSVMLLFQELVAFILQEYKCSQDHLNLTLLRFEEFGTAEVEMIAREYEFFRSYLAINKNTIDFGDFKKSLTASLLNDFEIKAEDKKFTNLLSSIRSLKVPQIELVNAFELYSILGSVLNDLVVIDPNRVPHTPDEMENFISLSMFIDEIAATMDWGGDYFTMQNVIKFSGTWRDTANDFYNFMEEENLDVVPMGYLIKTIEDLGGDVEEELIRKISNKSTRNKFFYMKKAFYETKLMEAEDLEFFELWSAWHSGKWYDNFSGFSF